jgi:glycosyltransferase involved in cell wall biosynthesis
MAKNIAFIHAGFPGGGAERVTRDIAKYLNEFNGEYKVHVFTRSIHKGLLSEEDKNNITVVETKQITAETLIELVQQHNINIVIQSSFPIKDIHKVKEATGVKVVFTCHEEPFWRRHITRHRGFFKKLTYKVLPTAIKSKLLYKQAVDWTMEAYRTCDVFTVLCDEYVEIIRRGLQLDHNHHIVAIENPEYRRQNINYQKENFILYSGRLDQMSKQLDKLLRIWKSIHDKVPEWKLIISGDGQDRDFLHKEAQRLELKRCEFIGLQTDMQSWYDRSSIVCLTSKTEGWPLCMTEAQASGCICIAFGCTAGVVNILSPSEDGTCGFIVSPNDEKEYASTLLSIIGMSIEETNKIRHNSVEKRLKYLPEIIAEKWRLLFDSLQ